jgi:ANTAR domain
MRLRIFDEVTFEQTSETCLVRAGSLARPGWPAQAPSRRPASPPHKVGSLVTEVPSRITRRQHMEKPILETPSQHDCESRAEGVADELALIRDENAHLKAALRSRTVIGQATGLLMATLNMAPDEAFAELARVSSHANRKVRDIAAEIVATAIDSGARDNVRSMELHRSRSTPSLSEVGPNDVKHRIQGACAHVRSDREPQA